jgi:hypothetical protein
MYDSDVEKIQYNIIKKMSKGDFQDSELFRSNTLNNDKNKETIENEKEKNRENQ